MKKRVAERSRFLAQWARAPLVTASMFPSSRLLAEAMARPVLPGLGPVVELGPGSGVITRCLIRSGVPESDLVVVECNGRFCRDLSTCFPGIRVVHGLAEQLGGMALDRQPGIVISSLPLMSMQNTQVEAILEAVFSALRPGGTMIQFTYAPRCPVNRSLRGRLGLVSRLRERVWRNVPPAGVYELQRIADQVPVGAGRA